MKTLRIAFSELKRMTNGTLPKLAMLSLILVPLLYGATYIYANWDPYKNLSGIDAALVVEDQGTTVTSSTPDGQSRKTQLKAGDDVAQDLMKSDSFHWVRTDPQDAAEGVRSGRYGFALTIPKDFSANLASPQSFDSAKQALFTVTTNDANNYVLSTIVGRLTQTIHSSVATQVGEKTADQLLSGYNSIHSSMLKAANGADQLTQGAKDASTGAGNLNTGLGRLHTGAGTLVDGQSKLVNASVQLSSGATTLSNGASSLSTGAGQLATGASTLHQGTSQLATGSDKLATGLETMNQKVTGLPGQAQQLANGAQQVANGNAELNQAVQDGVSALDSVDANAQAQAPAALQRLVDDGTITEAQAQAIRQRVLTSSAPQDLQAARNRVHQAAARVQALSDGASRVSQGAQSLATGASQLQTGISTAAASSRALANGAAQADQGALSLQTGASKLSTGANTLSGGASQLATGAGQLKQGQQQAYTGAVQLRDGLATAQNGSGQLKTGLDKLANGNSQLAGRIREGADQVPNPSETTKERASKVIADPVKVQDNAQTKAQSYGAGLAPFFLSLSLWIGVFILTQMMRPLTRRALASNASLPRVAVGGWIPFFVIAAAQALVLFAAITLMVGFHPVHPWMVLGTMLLGSFAFSAVIHGIVALLGAPGKLLVLVLMILQLVSSGGTFPWQTTPEPLHAVHQFLPMGYMVDAMRQLAYGGDTAVAGQKLTVLVVYGVLGLGLSVLAAARSRRWSLSSFRPLLTP